MRCTVCREDVPELDGQVKNHILISKGAKNGHVHVHGDLEGKANVQEMLELAAEEAGVALATPAEGKMPGEIVFHNRQRIGDMLVFTCAIRDFKAAFPHVRVNVISTAGHIWDHNPNVDRTLTPTDANTVMIGPSWLTNASNRLDWHFCNAFRVSIENALKIHIPQGESRPDIYLTQEEYDAPRTFGHPYWIICTSGEKGWGTKMYPHSKWQDVIDQNPDLIFVQIGTAEDDAPRLKGPNVIDYIGKTQSKETGIRDLFKLFLNSEGSIGLVSFHMHLSGALNKPCVVIAGAREPVHFTRYPGHAYLSTDGMLPCAVKACWHCSIDACTNLVDRGEKVPKCVDIIDSKDVTRAIQGYYTGGRLIKGVASPKPKLDKKHLIPTPPKTFQQLNEITLEADTMVSPYELPFGGGSLTDRDWLFMKAVMRKYGVESVLEFGAGLSTLLFNENSRVVVTYETNQGWIDKIRKIKHGCWIELWDGKIVPNQNTQYQLAFVDGPAGDMPRAVSTNYAAEHANLVIVHDAGREWARKYQEQYLAPGFDGPIKGGHRCHLWVKKGFKAPAGVKVAQKAPEVVEDSIAPCRTSGSDLTGIVAPVATKFVKIVSTAKGWGGCARSVSTIMKLLLKGGHKVEFIPFRNAVTSSEWKAILGSELKNVKVTADYSTVAERCDVLLMYADDYIWEFEQPGIMQAFSEIGGERKIMMLNYRRGKVGQAEWTKGWDKYMFLNSTQESELLKLLPGVKTKVLPPCTQLEPFFKVQPNYEGALRLVRHSSQGDTKFPKDFVEEVKAMQLAQKHELHLLPGPSFLPAGPDVFKYPRTDKAEVIADFLAKGNCFWYSVPAGYMDMGPRVILEAMASGLPIIADSWGGAVDRVTPECGWLFDKKNKMAELLPYLTPDLLKDKGEAARQRARDEFVPERWIKELFE